MREYIEETKQFVQTPYDRWHMMERGLSAEGMEEDQMGRGQRWRETVERGVASPSPYPLRSLQPSYFQVHR